MAPEVARRLLGLIGLGARGRLLVVGVEQVRVAAKRGQLAMAVVAPDASPHSLRKVRPLLEARRVRVIEGPDAALLGAALGRGMTAAVGILDRDLANGIRRIVDRGGAPEEVV